MFKMVMVGGGYLENGARLSANDLVTCEDVMGDYSNPLGLHIIFTQYGKVFHSILTCCDGG